jgi:drug/metabolite transporter (DMT)-like permease
MDNSVFLIVLVAAALHAGWNAMVKVGLDRRSTMLLIALSQGAIALPLVPFAPWPEGVVWAWLAGSMVLHVGYNVFLAEAYAHGDLSQVYPLARGSAPLIVMAVSAAFGARFTGGELLAVAAISMGIFAMTLKGSSAGRMRGWAVFWALGTAAFTAGYTLVDGLGARAAGSAFGFVPWMALGEALGMAAFAVALRGPQALRVLRPVWRGGLMAGAMSFTSYGIAIWGFTVAPIALVAALRETSILFAMLIGVVLLGERANRWRWGAAASIVTGVALMRLG